MKKYDLDFIVEAARDYEQEEGTSLSLRDEMTFIQSQKDSCLRDSIKKIDE